jgi:hypothetical protein
LRLKQKKALENQKNILLKKLEDLFVYGIEFIIKKEKKKIFLIKYLIIWIKIFIFANMKAPMPEILNKDIILRKKILEKFLSSRNNYIDVKHNGKIYRIVTTK